MNKTCILKGHCGLQFKIAKGSQGFGMMEQRSTISEAMDPKRKETRRSEWERYCLFFGFRTQNHLLSHSWAQNWHLLKWNLQYFSAQLSYEAGRDYFQTRFSQVISAQGDKYMQTSAKPEEEISDKKSKNRSTRQTVHFHILLRRRMSSGLLAWGYGVLQAIKYWNICQSTALCQSWSDTLWRSCNGPRSLASKKKKKEVSKISVSAHVNILCSTNTK